MENHQPGADRLTLISNTAFMILTCWYPKREKNARKMRENVSILHYALGKNAGQLRLSRVLVAFCSQTLTKRKTNAQCNMALTLSP